MPTSQSGHWEYTINEWKSDRFRRVTDPLPEDIGVIYDLGANVGGWAKVMQEKFPEAQIHCFEPVRENYEALTENMPHAHHHRLGIFYGKRESTVCSRGDKNVGAFFVEHIDAGPPIVRHDETIKLKTLEELDLPEPDLIKMDIEGAEENVIEHSAMVKHCPWLIIEWHPNTNPYDFFATHLPNHRIVVDLEKMQFLLCLK